MMPDVQSQTDTALPLSRRKPANTGDAAQDALLDTAAGLRSAADEARRRSEWHRAEAAQCDADRATIQGEIAQVEDALARLRN